MAAKTIKLRVAIMSQYFYQNQYNYTRLAN